MLDSVDMFALSLEELVSLVEKEQDRLGQPKAISMITRCLEG